MNQYLTVPLQIKALSARQIEGHGSIFGNVDLGGDVVMPGAFKESLAQHAADGSMPQMYWMHRMDQVPGKWQKMAEDKAGLAVEGILAKTPLGDEMHTLAKMKAVRGLSIGYYPTDTEYADDGVRIIKSVELIEVSLVSLAMNPLAQIEASKSRLSAIGEYVPTRREFEHQLRDVGMGSIAAKRLVSAAFDPTRDGEGIELDGIGEILELCGRQTEEIDLAIIHNLTRT
jgi:HK97 family phage prohead protease